MHSLEKFTPTAAQRAVFQSPARIVVVSGSIRSGKSLTASTLFAQRLLNDLATKPPHPLAYTGKVFDSTLQPAGTYWVLAPTFKLLNQSRAYVRGIFHDQHALFQAYLKAADELWLKHPRGGFVRIAFLSADNPHRLVGESVQGALVDESARCPRETWQGGIYGRLAQSRGWCVLASSPYGSYSNWTYELMQQAKTDPEIAAFNLFVRDNPAFPADMLREARRQLTDRYWRREFLGDWGSHGAKVYEDFDPARHVVSEEQIRLEYGLGRDRPLTSIIKRVTLNRGTWAEQDGPARVFYGCDWGLVDATAMTVTVETAKDEYLVVDEWSKSGVHFTNEADPKNSVVGQAWELKRKWGDAEWHCDHNPEYIYQFTRNGMRACNAKKDIQMGVRVVSTLLHGDGKTPRLRILDRCQGLIGELSSLEWDTDGDEQPIEGRFKDSIPNDISDAFRYSLAHLSTDIFDKDGIPRQWVARQFGMLGTWQGYVRV